MENNSKRFVVFQGQSVDDKEELDKLIINQAANGVVVTEYGSALDLYAVETARSLVNAYRDNDIEEEDITLNDIESEMAGEIIHYVGIETDTINKHYNDYLLKLNSEEEQGA